MIFKLQYILTFIFSFIISFSIADTTETTAATTITSVSPTLVWVTGTDSLGVTQTTQSTYYQSFITTYTENQESVSSGAIGLGSLTSGSHKIGDIRSYDMITISQGSGSNLKALSFNYFGDQKQEFGLSFFTKFLTLSFVFIVSSILFI
ncbi:KRE1 [Candida jiufengensis]|uniref:KRE1 n=1 Tax=Candida jiufengensis TaxID=497108 RepID=UPI0022259852|nr:KRE1 [Candida jiufengensis]KAI5954622.1 KRE1 [Candida jiufengensis]